MYLTDTLKLVLTCSKFVDEILIIQQRFHGAHWHKMPVDNILEGERRPRVNVPSIHNASIMQLDVVIEKNVLRGCGGRVKHQRLASERSLAIP